MIRKLLILCAVCLVLFACDKSTEPTYTVPTPTFSPLPGKYFSAQNVLINCTIDNVTIRYTVDGTDPSTSSAIYNSSAPIGISGATTIKARAYRNKMKPSAIASGSYIFDVGTLYFLPLGSTFTTPQTVVISASTSNSIIHYTTDGTEPTEASTQYTVPIPLDGNTVLKAKGFIAGWNPSATKTETYNFDVTSPVLDKVPETYYETFDLSMSTITEGAAIHYTLNGSEPTESSLLYSNPIAITTSKTVKARAFKNSWDASAIVSSVYVLKVATPIITPSSDIYYAPQNVNISCSTPESKIYYTTNGVNPTTNSTVYTGPFEISSSCTLRALAVRQGWTSSNIASSTYSFNVSTPTFNPLPSSSFVGPQNITLSCETPDAEIHYTLNSSGDPTLSSPLYIGPIAISTNTTINAKAFKTGLNPSQTATGFFGISNTVATPVFNPPGGVYYQPQSVAITCSTPGATIRFTTNNTEPNSESTQYTGPITVDAEIEVRAKAFKYGMTTSQTGVALYQFDTINQIVAWGGNNLYNQLNVPPGTDFSKIDAGMYHVVGLRIDGSIVAWGRNNYNQTAFPTGNNYTAVSAGDNHCLALKSDGSIVAWGRNDSLQCDIPDANLGYVYTAVSAGGNHSLALKTDGTLVAWGANASGQCNVPPGNNYVKIAAGANHNLALRADGTIVAWGNNDSGQINAQTGSNFADIAAGDQHCVAKYTDNSLVAWGSNSSGQIVVPTGNNFSKVSAGYRHNIALKNDGTLSTWGYSGAGLGTVPATTTYMDVAAGRDFSVALKATAATNNRSNLKNLRPKFKL